MQIADHEKWMEVAIRLAEKAAKNDEVPIGAVLVLKDQIVGEGANSREKPPRTTGHAEIIAIENYCQRANDWRFHEEASLYVTAEPCVMCTGALLWARVKHIYFGCSDPKNAGLRSLLPEIESGRFDHRFQTVQGGLLEPQCASLLTTFFSNRR